LFASLQEAFRYLEAFTNLEKKPHPKIREYRLDRMAALLSAFDNPHQHGKIFHLAGSKGKGSTAIFLSKLLEEQGFTVGLYTSPHISSYTERISLGGLPFPEDVYLENIAAIHRFLRAKEPFPQLPADIAQEPTTFELLTLLAFLIFRQTKVDAIVLETGLGGRLDATNLVHPLATLITPIELEHTAILGTTLEAIAGEKAGIIKEGVPLFLSPQDPEAQKVFYTRAAKHHAPLYALEDFPWKPGPWRFNQGKIHRDQDSQNKDETLPLSLAMAGAFQAWNFLLALSCFLHFYPESDPSSWQRAASLAKLPGRMEILSSAPWIILDGGHTPRAMERLAESLQDLEDPPRTLLFGAVEGKDIPGMARVLAGHFDQIYLTRAGSFRPSDIPAMVQAFQAAGALHIQPFPSPREAWEAIKDNPQTPKSGVLITGSFFLLGELKPWL
jgi:dihydrofolate synthase/folylpolyglutamate synthase